MKGRLSPAERTAILLTAAALCFMAWETLRLPGYTVSTELIHRRSAAPPSPSFIADWTLDLNTASLEELMALPGIGPARAQAILDYRAAEGPFSAAEALLEVPGIGPAVYEQLEQYVTVGP